MEPNLQSETWRRFINGALFPIKCLKGSLSGLFYGGGGTQEHEVAIRCIQDILVYVQTEYCGNTEKLVKTIFTFYTVLLK